MKHLPLKLDKHGRSISATVDDDIFNSLCGYEWRAKASGVIGKNPYVVRRGVGGRQVPLHREITGATPGQVVDHIDGDPLNNVRSNLRVCSIGENVRNRRKTSRPTTSRFKGVHLTRRRTKPWTAQIKINGKMTYVGCFDDERSAAVAYDSAALKHFGEFANLNFPDLIHVHNLLRNRGTP